MVTPDGMVIAPERESWRVGSGSTISSSPGTYFGEGHNLLNLYQAFAIHAEVARLRSEAGATPLRGTKSVA
jgi:hypothetical protein